ncbi:MAG: thioredoxin domain-containing protein [Candidatus Paceibacterota bacterium]
MINKESKQERNERKARLRTAKKTFYLALGVVAVVALILGLMWVNGQNSNSNGVAGAPANVEAVTADDQVIGDRDNAQAILVEYSDYQCPACAFYEPLVKDILAEYESQGLVLVYRHFPLSGHAHALATAKAAEAAGRQGQFWPMHDLIFEHQEVWSLQSTSEVETALLGYASDLGLDLDQFKIDMASSVVTEKIQRDLASGRRAGVRGTPTFYLNGREVSVRTLEQFKTLIRAALNTDRDVETEINTSGSIKTEPVTFTN